MRDNKPRRRKLLKEMGGAVGVGAILGTGQAAAETGGEPAVESIDADAEVLSDTRGDRLVARYAAPDAVRAAVAEYGGDVLAELRDEGWLESADVGALPTADVQVRQGALSPSAPEAATAVTPLAFSGTETAVITVSLADPRLTVFVMPELDRSYAVVTDGDVPKIVNNGSYSCYSSCAFCWSECSGFCQCYRFGVCPVYKKWIHIDCVDYEGDRTFLIDWACEINCNA